MEAPSQDLDKQAPTTSGDQFPLRKMRTQSPKAKSVDDAEIVNVVKQRPVKSKSMRFLFEEEDQFFDQKCVRHKSVSGSRERKYITSYRNEPPCNIQELNELLSLDIGEELKKEQEFKRSVKEFKRRLSNMSSDGDVYVEETMHFLYEDLQSEQETMKKLREQQLIAGRVYRIEENISEATINQGKNLWQMQNNDTSLLPSDLPDKDDQDEDALEEKVNKLVMQMMMSGEDPDAEIDKLLETFDLRINQLGGTKNFFKGDFLDNDIRLGEAMKEAIEDINQTVREWRSPTAMSEVLKKKFLTQSIKTAESLGVSLTVEHLLPALQEIFMMDDLDIDKMQEYIRAMFGKFDVLITFLSESQITAGYNGIRDYLCPMYYEFFMSERVEDSTRADMQESVICQLAQINKILTHEDRVEKVLPICLDCLKDDSDEEKRIMGLEMLDKLVKDLGADICANYLMYEIVSLQDDPVYRVRRETVKRIVNISTVVSNEMFMGVLLPVFKRLAQDQIWGVRRQAVEVLPHICSLAPDDIKNTSLLDIFKKFTNDSSKWVKQAATQFLGPFIVCYQGLEPSPVLIEFYSSMAEQQGQEETTYHCAFNFPAVLLTLGPKAWPQLKPIHDKLVRDTRVKVRRTLAFSLFELAAILGHDLTEQELISVFFHFLKDVNDVREGVTRTLPKFLRQLSEQQRESYVQRFAEAWNSNEENWRKREKQAKQLRKFAELISPESFNKYFVATFFQLCADQVAEVRLAASKSTLKVAQLYQKDPQLFAWFKEQVFVFQNSKKYNMRQTFISMCASIMKGDSAMFQEHFLENFVKMQTDKIINVRMHLSETLQEYFTAINVHEINIVAKEDDKQIYNNAAIVTMVKRLKYDVRDISFYLKKIKVKEDESQVPMTPEQIAEQENPELLALRIRRESVALAERTQFDEENILASEETLRTTNSSSSTGGVTSDQDNSTITIAEDALNYIYEQAIKQIQLEQTEQKSNYS